MRVKAKNRGIHGSRRWKPGQEVDVDPKHFNASWMEEVKRGPGRPKKVEEPKAKKPAKTASVKA